MKLWQRLACAVGLVLALPFGCVTPSVPTNAVNVERISYRMSDEDIDQAEKAVYQLLIYSKNQPVGRGSVTIVGREADGDTVALTAGHCVDEPSDKFVVIDENGKIHQGKVTQKGAYESEIIPGFIPVETGFDKDWAIIVFEGTFGEPLQAFLKDSVAPEKLEIVVIGYAIGKGKVSRGLTYKPEDGMDGLLTYIANSGPGSSGGAVIGLVAGKPTLLAIHTRGWRDRRSLTIWEAGVPVSSIVKQGAKW